METIGVSAGPYRFRARFEDARSPQTCAMMRALLPYSERLMHVRWSGEAVWIPLGDRQFGVGWEDATSHPAPGEMIFYPGGVSETEILLAYGPTRFASKAGQLAGNHFLTIVEGLENLHALGRLTLLEGAQPIVFETS